MARLRNLARFLLPAISILLIASSSRAADEPPSQGDPDSWIDRGAKEVRHYTQPVGDSTWLELNQQKHRELLDDTTYDVLIVPVQLRDFGIRRSLRLLTTAELAWAIQETTGLSVADPFMVWQVLGGDDRQLHAGDAVRLARRLKVKHLIQVYIGHIDNQLLLSVKTSQFSATIENSATHIRRAIDFANVPRDNEISVVENLIANLDGILEAAGLQRASNITEVQPSSGGFELPQSLFPDPDTLSPIGQAYHLQTLAMLTPPIEERTRDRLFVKSLIALKRVPIAAEDRRVLAARAMFYLGQRLKSIQMLKSPDTISERALLATLNGNLTELDAQRQLIKKPLQKLYASIEAVHMRYMFKLDNQEETLEEARIFSGPDPLWNYSVENRLLDFDNWHAPSMEPVKNALDLYFPLPGSDLRSGAFNPYKISRSNPDTEPQKHIDRLLEIRKEDFCCSSFEPSVSKLDYVDFLSASAASNIVRRARKHSRVYGNPTDAIEYLDSLNPVYLDHPGATAERAYAERSLASKSDAETASRLNSAAAANASKVLYWEQGQSKVADTALRLRTDLKKSKNWWLLDRPYHPRYVTFSELRTRDRLETDNANFGLVSHLVKILSRRGESEVDELLESVSHRFVGSPQRIELLVERAISKGHVDVAVALLEEGIEKQPNYEEFYQELGQIYVDLDDYRQAAEVFAQNPVYADPNAHRVGLATTAYTVGSLFWWRGSIEDTAHFYRIASDLNTGSEASMVGTIRLALIDGDYTSAIMGSARRGQRYSSSPAWRDYISLLSMADFSEESWEAFNYFSVNDTRPHVWESLLVLQHRDQTSEADVIKWATQDHLKSLGGRHRYAATHLVRFGVIDRTPSEAIIDALKKLDARTGTPTAEDLKYAKEPTRPAFTRSYQLIKLGQFEEARQYMQDNMPVSSMHSINSRLYTLPYQAFAAAMAGNTAEFESQLSYLTPFDRRTGESREFDINLSKGVLAALDGDTDTAVKLIRAGFNKRPFTEYRPISPDYAYAEICEWLWEATGEEVYRQLALDWAVAHQTIQPWFAWSYAMEAKLTSDPVRKLQAATKAYYLDADSERLNSLSKEELALVQKQGERPFYIAVENSDGETPL